MLQALLDDLAELADVEVSTTRDPRLPLPSPAKAGLVRVSQEDIWQQWERCILESEAVWPIAPESGGALERLSSLAAQHGKCLLGSSPRAVALTSSKLDTVNTLATHGVATVPTFRPWAITLDWQGAWVAKPDDGAGCDGTQWFGNVVALQTWLDAGAGESYVVQPYCPGIPASLSMICRDGRAWLLSCNRQLVALQEGRFSYGGSVINGMAEHWHACERVAAAVAAAIPGLAGYVGVDVLVDAHGEVTVLEINPRLTTSYAGLHQAIGCNPARLVLDLLYNDGLQLSPMMERNVVEIILDA